MCCVRAHLIDLHQINTKIYHFPFKMFGDIAKNVVSLHRQKVNRLFDGLVATDGHKSSRGQTSYSTVSEQLWQDFLLLCQYVGRETATYIRDNVPNWSTAYKVNVKQNKPKLLRNIDEVYYEGKVYCAETSTNLLYVRRNGKANVSGNSRRYISHPPELFLPTFRTKPDGSVKQGSGGEHPDNDIIREAYHALAHECLELYSGMIAQGVAAEQARFILPQGVETNWVWTGSLYAWARFYNQRTDLHAQKEIQDLAKMVGETIKPLYPHSWKALVGDLK